MDRSRRQDSGTAALITVPPVRAERDIVALGIIVAAIILFVATGSNVVPRALRHILFGEANVDVLLTNALLLNIALIIFGWRRYVDLTREIAERRESEAQARRLAESDPLTGALNRRSFDSRLAAMVAEAQASGGEIALVLIDLDKFKRSNDTHGHQAGDAVLLETARRVADLLPRGGALARLGGDEFAVIVRYDRGGFDAADRLVAQIRSAIAQPVPHGDRALHVTASIGIACLPMAHGDALATAPAELMRQADMAMYQAKRSGRDRHCWFSPEVERTVMFRSWLEQAVRDGVARGEFVPFYEKQVDIASGRLTGFEMLARWNCPNGSAIGPDVFVPVAEEIGVMAELSDALIRQALHDARDWAPHLTLAINISPLQLRDPWFAQKLLKQLVEARIQPGRIEIEITESSLKENLAVVRSLITSLRNQGVRISLDDFGNGYSSIAHLRTLPFDRIKIDRAYIAGLGQSKDSESVVEAISSLGRGMALPITAEGIENTQILEELRKYGTFCGQGYVYGQPLSAADLRHELAQQDLLAREWPESDAARDLRQA